MKIRTFAMLTAMAMLTTAIIPTTAAAPPGDLSRSFSVFALAEQDFKTGTGVYDPMDENNPCTAMILGLRPNVGSSTYYDFGRIYTNANTVVTHVPAASDVDLGVACPLPPASPGNLALKQDGINVYGPTSYVNNDILLCTSLVGKNCFPVVGSQDVRGSACAEDEATFRVSNDTSTFWPAQAFIGNSAIECADWQHEDSTGDASHNYSASYTDFSVGNAGTAFDVIKVSDLVHSGDGSAYAVVCVNIDYTQIDTVTGTVDGTMTAAAHDWFWVIDGAAAALPTNLLAMYDLSGDNGTPCPSAEAPAHNDKPSS